MRLAIKPKKNQSFVDRYFEQKQDQTFRILVSERLHQTFLEDSFPMMKLEMITTIFVSKKKNGSKAQYLALAWLNVVRKNCDISRFIPVYLHCIYAFCSRNSYSADAKKLFAFLWKSKTDQINRLFFSSHYPKVDWTSLASGLPSKRFALVG